MDELNYSELQFFKKNAAYIEERLDRITVLFNKEPKTEKDFNEALMCKRHINAQLHDMLSPYSDTKSPATLAKTHALQRRCEGLLAQMLG